MTHQPTQTNTMNVETIAQNGLNFPTSDNWSTMNRRTLIFAALGSAVAVACPSVSWPQASSGIQPMDISTGAGERIAVPGARAVDHAGFTVPDLEQAVTFFTDVFGAAVLWRSAPFTADGLAPRAPAGLNADPSALSRLAMLRLGPNLNIELVEYRIPGVSQLMPLS
ncbi:MAG: hypothetical protein H7Y86_17790, partial [Rhizobacter sp.]|nr:hypothetical protein [Ferruginibacter sp.]